MTNELATASSVSLDEFVANVRKSLAKFEADWRAKNVADPNGYPLSLPAENSGLWLEFFTDVCNGEGV